MPPLPELYIRMASVPPLVPVWKIISAPVVPTPEVDLKSKVLVVLVPPIIKGEVKEVVKVGEVPKTKLPVPVSSERESIKYWEVPEEVNWPLVVVKTPREAVRFEKVIAPEEVMPVKPEATPAVETSQVVESIATVSEPLPIVTAPPLVVKVPVLVRSVVARLESKVRIPVKWPVPATSSL